jgi:hypothetical protein
MKSIILIASLLLPTCTPFVFASIQAQPAIRIKINQPYDKGVPGLILELQVAGLGGTLETSLPAEDFTVEVTQDGVAQKIKARLVRHTMTAENNADGTQGEFKSFYNVSFVVPQGLHPGEASVLLSYRNKHSDQASLMIVQRPMKPLVGGLVALSVGSALGKIKGNPMLADRGMRLERDSQVELRVLPLTDPEDNNSAVLIRFKQGNNSYDGNARVVHHAQRTEQMDGGVAFLPADDVLEVQVPAALSMGPADMEIQVRANGQDSEPTMLKVQITDATRIAEAPAENAPRLLAVAPDRIGAGQTFMVSVDYLRTLNPDPAQAMILIEQGPVRYVVKPDMNSALRMPNWRPDAPVVLMARATRQFFGPAKIHVFNALRGEQGGLSEPKSIEILDEVLPPEVSSVAESSAGELAPLTQMYEIQHKAGRPFPEYDPENRYITIRGQGFDFNPWLVRIELEQKGKKATLAYRDFSFQGNAFMIVRVPEPIGPGPVTIRMQNRSEDSFSEAVVKTFELSKRN